MPDICGVRCGPSEGLHLTPICALPAGHDGPHSNVLPKSGAPQQGGGRDA